MTEVKPIAVVYLPKGFSFNDNNVVDKFQLLKELNGVNPYSSIESSLGGYLWFVFEDESLSVPKIEVKIAEGISEEEMKALIDKSEGLFKKYSSVTQ